MFRLACIGIFATLGSASPAPVEPSIPEYLRIGIEKFAADAGTSMIPQAELMTSLVLTGHAGKNVHTHRMQLHTTSLPGNRKKVHEAKGIVIRSLEKVFQAIEDSHKAILTQVQIMMPTPEIIRGLAKATTSIAVCKEVLKQLSLVEIIPVSNFYREMHDVLERALGLRAYLVTLKPVFSDAVVDSLITPNASGLSFIQETVASVIDGYTKLRALGASDSDFESSFNRVEFDHVWEN